MNINFALDPLNKFTHVDGDDIMEACGFIPGWISLEYDNDILNFKEILEKHYHYGAISHLDKSVINDDGSYSYPGDPIMYPLLRIRRKDETFYQYQYGMIGIVNNVTGEQLVTRCD